MKSIKEKVLTTLRKDNVQAYLMLSPAVIGFLMFTLYPIIWVLRYSFYYYDGFSTPEFVGLANFVRVFTRDPKFWMSLENTMWITLGRIAIVIPLAVVIAVLIRKKGGINAFFRTIYFLPTIVSIAITGVIFYVLFEPFSGIVNHFMVDIGLVSKPIEWFSSRWTAIYLIIITSLWGGLGMNMIYFLMGLQGIPESLYESAEIDGANRVQQFFHITLPMLYPILRIVVLLMLIRTMKMTDLVIVLTDGQPGGQSEVAMSYIFKYFFASGEAASSQYGYASAMAIVLAIILAIVTFIYNKFFKGKKY